jgi:hypothetical protein
MRYLVLLCAVLALPVVSKAQDTTFTFHGIHLGDSLVRKGGAHDGCSDRPDNDSLVTCFGGIVNIGTVVSSPIRGYFHGRLMRYSLVFGSDNFEEMTHAFSMLFGQPSMSAEPVETRSGGTLTNSVASWRLRGESVTVYRYQSRSDMGQLAAVDSVRARAWVAAKNAGLAASMRQPERTGTPQWR